MSYTPALPSNSQVFIYVSDSNGAEAWSNTVRILPAFRSGIFSEFPNLNSSRSRSAMAIRPASVPPLLTKEIHTTRQRTTRQRTTRRLTTRRLTTRQLTIRRLTTRRLTTHHPTTLTSRPPTTPRPMMLILRIKVPLRMTLPMLHPHQAPLPRQPRTLTPPPSKRICDIHTRKEFALTCTPQ